MTKAKATLAFWEKALKGFGDFKGLAKSKTELILPGDKARLLKNWQMLKSKIKRYQKTVKDKVAETEKKQAERFLKDAWS